jgi:hypothetical protein
VLKTLEEHRQYATLQKRLEDDDWVGVYLDLSEQQCWLDSVEGVRCILPFMLAAAIYRRDSNEDAVAVGHRQPGLHDQPQPIRGSAHRVDRTQE